LAKSLLENPRFKFALVKEMQSNEGFTVAKEDYSRVVGETGHAVTALRPSGKVEIEGDVFDAVAQVSYIEQGSLIKVIDYRNGQLVVRRII
jgi:membrane-bound serine protease (ClpP class)